MPHRGRLGWIVRAALLTCAMATLAFATVVQQLWTGNPPPVPPAIPAHRSVVETLPLAVTVTRDWQKVDVSTSMSEVTWSLPLWLEMHFGDWDRLSVDVRRRALLRMRARFADVVDGPIAWAAMDAQDWDAVPQPIRMVVFPLMVEHWVRHYGLGRGFGLSHRRVADTVSAIVMAESWFQHRADVENDWGNRDIGLGQCSDRCRRDLARMADKGLLEFVLTDEDYLNPWNATRAAVVWFGLELARGYGDVELAVRAYHRGFEAACRGEGTPYLKNVRRLRAQYFGPKPDRSPTWQALAAWAAERAARASAPAAVLAAATPSRGEPSTASSPLAALRDDVSGVARRVAAHAALQPGGEGASARRVRAAR